MYLFFTFFVTLVMVIAIVHERWIIKFISKKFQKMVSFKKKHLIQENTQKIIAEN